MNLYIKGDRQKEPQRYIKRDRQIETQIEPQNRSTMIHKERKYK